jgi:hypothetical protein
MELGNGWSWATDGVGQRMELGNGWSSRSYFLPPLPPPCSLLPAPYSLLPTPQLSS